MPIGQPALNDRISTGRSRRPSAVGPSTTRRGPPGSRSAFERPAPDTVSPWTPAARRRAPPADAAPMRWAASLHAPAAVLLAHGLGVDRLVRLAGGRRSSPGPTSPARRGGRHAIPPWLIAAWIVGLVLAIVTDLQAEGGPLHRPALRRRRGPAARWHLPPYEVQFEGIVLQAVGLTIGVFASCCSCSPPASSRSPTSCAWASSRHRRHLPRLHGLDRPEPLRRRRPVHPRRRAGRHPASACSSSASRRSTCCSTSTSSSGASPPAPALHGVVRRVRPARHAGVAVPRAAPAAGQAPPLTSRRVSASSSGWPAWRRCSGLDALCAARPEPDRPAGARPTRPRGAASASCSSRSAESTPPAMASVTAYAGLRVVVAVGEAAAGGELLDVGEGERQPLGLPQPDAPQPRGVDQHPAARERRRGGG